MTEDPSEIVLTQFHGASRGQLFNCGLRISDLGIRKLEN
jgi:hypothetical protein